MIPDAEIVIDYNTLLLFELTEEGGDKNWTSIGSSAPLEDAMLWQQF